MRWAPSDVFKTFHYKYVFDIWFRDLCFLNKALLLKNKITFWLLSQLTRICCIRIIQLHSSTFCFLNNICLLKTLLFWLLLKLLWICIYLSSFSFQSWCSKQKYVSFNTIHVFLLLSQSLRIVLFSL